MGDVSLELIHKLMLEIQASQEASTHKIGSLAESIVGIKRDITKLDSSVTSLVAEVYSARTDIATLAVAVDEHTHRLDRIETRLEGIEKQLNLTHA